jgi:hypothetical protein
MKKIFVLIISMVMVFFAGKTNAQEKSIIKIASIKQAGEMVDFTLTSSKPFIFGGNRYMLFVGDKDFTRYEQSHHDGRGTITFFIPKEDFNNLKEGAAIYLSYGRVSKAGAQNMEETSKQSRRCWSLGKFSQKLQTK